MTHGIKVGNALSDQSAFAATKASNFWRSRFGGATTTMPSRAPSFSRNERDLGEI
ncbi:MAG: hypothetical protein R3E83_03995 [Burkholderiaceae bacterium]